MRRVFPFLFLVLSLSIFSLGVIGCNPGPEEVSKANQMRDAELERLDRVIAGIEELLAREEVQNRDLWEGRLERMKKLKEVVKDLARQIEEGDAGQSDGDLSQDDINRIQRRQGNIAREITGNQELLERQGIDTSATQGNAGSSLTTAAVQPEPPLVAFVADAVEELFDKYGPFMTRETEWLLLDMVEIYEDACRLKSNERWCQMR